MKVFIVGGSGFVGNNLAKHLFEQGHQVTVGSRKGAGSVQGVEYVALDAAKNEGFKEALTGKNFEAVIYLVGIIRESGGQTFQQAHIDGVRNTLQACQANGIKRYLHMSALGAVKGTGSRYFETKAVGEELVQASGLDWTIFRPSLIFGLGDDFFGNVLKGLVQAPLPFIPLIGNGRFPFRPVWIGDVASAFAQALTLPNTVHRSYTLVGPKEYSFRHLLALVQDNLGSKKPFLSIPLWLMDRIVPLMSSLPFSPLTLDQYIMLKQGNTADANYAREVFHLAERSLEVELPGILTTKRLVSH